MGQPLVSVLLSVYNGAATLPLCLASVADQTWKDFEVIVVDDGSSDPSGELVRAWQEAQPYRRIRLIQHSVNRGLARSLNDALAVATGKYVARLDADDWWTPTKLAQQMDFLHKNTEHELVGCWYINVRSTGNHLVQLPLTDAEIRQAIFWRNPFGHSCVVMRKVILDQVGGYNERLRWGQDRDLWFRLLPHTKLANLNEVLCYRTVNPLTSTTNVRAQIWQQCRTLHTYIRKYRVSPLAYVSLIEPLILFLLPAWGRQALRTAYDRFFAD